MSDYNELERFINDQEVITFIDDKDETFVLPRNEAHKFILDNLTECEFEIVIKCSQKTNNNRRRYV